MPSVLSAQYCHNDTHQISAAHCHQGVTHILDLFLFYINEELGRARLIHINKRIFELVCYLLLYLINPGIQ